MLSGACPGKAGEWHTGISSRRKMTFMERFVQQSAQSVESENLVYCPSDSVPPPVKKIQRRSRRFLVEAEILVLQKQLQSEVNLHIVLKNVASGVRPQYHPKDVPTAARELLEDIAALENVVAALEEQAIALQGKIGDERRARESLERLGAYWDEQNSPVPSKGIPVLPREAFSLLRPGSKSQLLETFPLPDFSWKSEESDTLFQESVNFTFPLDPEVGSRCLAELDTLEQGRISAALQAESPFLPAGISLSGASTSDQSGSQGPSSGPERDVCTSSPLSSKRFITAEEFFNPKTSIPSFDDRPGKSPSRASSAENQRSGVRVKLSLQTDEKKLSEEGILHRNSYDAEYVTHRRLMSDLLPAGLKLDSLSPNFRSGVHDSYIGRDYSQTPNLLSEEMMKCMIGIYWYLANPTVVSQSSYDSPSSHFGNTSLSYFSESSLRSLGRSPHVDWRSKDEVLGCESSPDPYRSRGKLPWADIGLYGKAVEVPWMSVRTEHLGCGTQSLDKFRYLAEQLSEVDPLLMSHSQKLAFWLNLFNSLMMHAFLTYGIPRNDLKFLALMEKAVFIVGGHSFSAATIEHSLLKGKTFSYRPQLGLLVALHRNRFALTEDQSKFAIDYSEPQIIFSLCCGARSSPAVRVYTAGKVHKEINLALRDYARATVGLSGKGKLLVPKLLYLYAHDFVDDGSILDWVCQFLPMNQAGLVREHWQHRQNRLLGTKSFSILPLELNFRYLFAPSFDPSSDID